MQSNAKRIFRSPTQMLVDAADNPHCVKEDLTRLKQRNYAVGIQHITDALIACGYTALDEQAKALGIHRSTTWTIVKTKHKLGRLSTKTTTRILANPGTPPAVRAVLQRYLAERSDVLRNVASDD